MRDKNNETNGRLAISGSEIGFTIIAQRIIDMALKYNEENSSIKKRKESHINRNIENNNGGQC